MGKLLSAFVLVLLCASGVWAQTSLTGLWIDSRTGNDFWEINGTDEAFRFTAYGGTPSQPRYLSRGVALALETGELRATMRDLPGHCCGQQGSLRVKMVSANQLEVTGQYKAMDSAEPPVEVSFTLSRAGSGQVANLPLPSITYDDPEPEFTAGKTTATWQGVWQGDGWGSFLITQDNDKLYMYWYYSKESPFYGEYAVNGNTAKGTAVAIIAKPGNTYYEHELTLRQTQITVVSRRLAAPLEDGRLVSWSNAPLNSFVLQKVNDQLPATEDKRQWFTNHNPQKMLQSALDAARQGKQLIEREK